MAAWVGADRINKLITPTVDTSAYAANDCIGTLIEITHSGAGLNGPVNDRSGSGKISRATLYDKASQIQTHAIQAYIFKDNPTSSTFTDQAAFNINDADLTKLECVITFDTANGSEFGSSSANQMIQRINLGITYETSTDSLYVDFKAIGTPTFGSSSDLSMRLIFERD